MQPLTLQPRVCFNQLLLRLSGDVFVSSQLASPSPPLASGAIGQIYDLSVVIAPIHQLAAAKDAIITVSFSLHVALPTGKDINIWVPANFIEKSNQARYLLMIFAFVFH